MLKVNFYMSVIEVVGVLEQLLPTKICPVFLRLWTGDTNTYMTKQFINIQ